MDSLSKNIVWMQKFIRLYRSLALTEAKTGTGSAVGNVSGYRCVAECKSRDREFDPDPVPYFCGD